MKKLIVMMTAAALALSFAACGSKTDSESSATSTETTVPTESTTDTAADTTVATDTTEAAFEEIVLVDNEDITVKVTGINEDTIWGYALTVYLENKTDKNLMFSLSDVSVNGFMCDPYWAQSVAAGMKSNTEVSWFDDDLKANGIREVEDVTFTLRIYDSNDWTAEDVLNESFTLHLHG